MNLETGFISIVHSINFWLYDFKIIELFDTSNNRILIPVSMWIPFCRGMDFRYKYKTIFMMEIITPTPNPTHPHTHTHTHSPPIQSISADVILYICIYQRQIRYHYNRFLCMHIYFSVLIILRYSNCVAGWQCVYSIIRFGRSVFIVKILLGNTEAGTRNGPLLEEDIFKSIFWIIAIKFNSHVG